MNPKAKKGAATAFFLIFDVLIVLYVVLAVAVLATGGFKFHILWFGVSCTKLRSVLKMALFLILARSALYALSSNRNYYSFFNVLLDGCGRWALWKHLGSRRIGIAVLILALLLVAFQMERRIRAMEKRMDVVQKSVCSMRNGLFNDMVDNVTEGSMDDAERCKRIAGYIASHVSNAEDTGDSDAPVDILGLWESRRGVCSERSMIMIEALKRLNIPAKIWNIYDYGFGHTCVQAYYDLAWHFFDPTYGGYFTGDDGHVLSWREIMGGPETAVTNLVAFEPSLDADDKGLRVDNPTRMKNVYAPARLRLVRNAGGRGTRIFRVPVHIDLARMNNNRIELGKKDGSHEEMRSREVQAALGTYYLDALGNCHDNFVFEVFLENPPSADELEIRFSFTKEGAGGARLVAKAQKGWILDGARGPVCSQARNWTIHYKPDGREGKALDIGLDDFSQRSYCYIDNLTIEKAL